jgi:hypothetical protein
VPGGIWQIHIDSVKGKLIATIPLPKKKKEGWVFGQAKISVVNGMHDLYFTYVNPNLKKPEDNGAILDWFYFTEELPGKNKPGYVEIKNTVHCLHLSAHHAVMIDNLPDMHRISYVFERGNWLVRRQGDTGRAQISEPIPSNAPPNRLGLAMVNIQTKSADSKNYGKPVWEQLLELVLWKHWKIWGLGYATTTLNYLTG